MREGKFVETHEQAQALGNTYRWPTVTINSYEFNRLPHYERFRQLARGYLHSAKSLCVELGENPERLDWPRAAAASFCHYHAVELFIKACILYKTPTDKLSCHDVTELKDRYHELYPEYRYFGFQSPWDLRAKDVEKLLGMEPNNRYFDGKADQAYRYLADKRGQPPNETYFFAPGTWLAMAEQFEDDMDRIWSNILEQQK